jgi:hypothetical protein
MDYKKLFKDKAEGKILAQKTVPVVEFYEC